MGFQRVESLFIIGFIIIALVICALQWLQKTMSMSFNISAPQMIAVLDAKASQDGLKLNYCIIYCFGIVLCGQVACRVLRLTPAPPGSACPRKQPAASPIDMSFCNDSQNHLVTSTLPPPPREGSSIVCPLVKTPVELTKTPLFFI